MRNLSSLGNDLYTGRRSVPFIGRRRTWYALSAVLMAVALLGLGVQGLNLGMEFTGGSEFRVSAPAEVDAYESRAREAVTSVEPGEGANITRLGTDTIRVQTERLDDAQSEQVRQALAEEFGVAVDQVSASFVGPSWGRSVSEQALRALAVFLALTFVVMAVYFRTWKMSVAAMVALVHDMVVTVGIYAFLGFEGSPATMIGFLTVLGYSLYDTVVVFDKVRENTHEALATGRMTYAAAANLAVNQTVVRSINTTVVALLPIGAVLLVGFATIGPGTLLDLALVLFIGMAVGAYSSLFIATPLLVTMRQNEPAICQLDRQAAKHLARQSKAAAKEAAEEERRSPVTTGTAPEQVAATGEPLESVGAPDRAVAPGEEGSPPRSTAARKVHPYAQTGPRNQPRRPPRSRR